MHAFHYKRIGLYRRRQKLEIVGTPVYAAVCASEIAPKFAPKIAPESAPERNWEFLSSPRHHGLMGFASLRRIYTTLRGCVGLEDPMSP